jgi:DNA-binding transcriptional ArsR family regulator
MKINDLNIEQLEMASNMLKAIAHPVRIAILNNLGEGRMLTVTEIHQRLEIEQSAASHHLGILKDKGVLASKREGKNTYYYLKYERLTDIIDCIGKCYINKKEQE